MIDSPPETSALADDQARRIEAIRQLLGPPSSESHLQLSGTPFFYQATWNCGCTVEYLHEERAAYWWEACDEHASPECSA
jgi:hypothetical protein